MSLGPRLRAGLVLAATAAVCLPVYRGAAEPALVRTLRPLAIADAVAAAALLDGLGVAVVRSGTELRSSPAFAIDVTVHCTAWLWLALWIAGLVSLGGGARWLRQRWRLGLAGLAAIAAANLLRLVLLVVVGARWPELFEPAHRIGGEALLAATWLVAWTLAVRGEAGVAVRAAQSSPAPFPGPAPSTS